MLGGAASGKSAFAEALLGAHEAIYIATAQAFDTEMRAKVDRHIARRGPRWHTIEAPLNLSGALSGLTAEKPVLIDCATMWLTNHLLAGSDLALEQARLLDALSACPASVVIVSNEVGQGIVPDNALARSFREAQGGLNVALAAWSDCTVQVVAGLSNVLKGALP